MAVQHGSEVFIPDLVSKPHSALPFFFPFSHCFFTFSLGADVTCSGFRAPIGSGDWSRTALRATGGFKALSPSLKAAVRGILPSVVRIFSFSAAHTRGYLDCLVPYQFDILRTGNTLYTLHELSSTLTQQQIPPAPNGTSSIIASFSILPPNPPPQADWHAAEILLTEASLSFPHPFIYVSNRNTGPVLDPRGDAIAIFKVEPKLTFVKHVYTGLDQIRGMMIGGPQNEYLIAAGVAGDAGVIMLKRTKGGADLEIIANNTDLPTRTSFVWLD